MASFNVANASALMKEAMAGAHQIYDSYLALEAEKKQLKTEKADLEVLLKASKADFKQAYDAYLALEAENRQLKKNNSELEGLLKEQRRTLDREVKRAQERARLDEERAQERAKRVSATRESQKAQPPKDSGDEVLDAAVRDLYKALGSIPSPPRERPQGTPKDSSSVFLNELFGSLLKTAGKAAALPAHKPAPAQVCSTCQGNGFTMKVSPDGTETSIQNCPDCSATPCSVQ